VFIYEKSAGRAPATVSPRCPSADVRQQRKLETIPFLQSAKKAFGDLRRIGCDDGNAQTRRSAMKP
jgi:hypothetical protein